MSAVSEEDHLSYRLHRLTAFARVEGRHITYPPEQSTLLL